jgi:dTDP-4-amino-4,6-dideoxygalactose transaminase
MSGPAGGRATFLPYNRPDLTDEEVAAVVEAVRSGWISRGPRVTAFERALSEYLDGARVVAVSSCTAALHLGLVLAGIGPGDEVVTTPLTFAASVNVILHVGATPVLADVDPRTGCLSPEAAAAAVTARTRAVMPVDYAGHPAALDGFQVLARRHGLQVIEDAAHAVATTYRGRKIGTWPWYTAFSFYATKNLATGEGGALVCPDAETEARARRLALHGMSQDAWRRYETGSWYYEVTEAGFKYNMTDVQAALGLVQLRRLAAMQERRRAIAAAFTAAFADEPALEVPVVDPDAGMAWHLYPLRIRPEQLTLSRDRFIAELQARRIGTSVHFIPIHYHPYYRDRFGWRPGMWPAAEDYYAREISLPLYPGMTDQDVDDVIWAVRDVVARHRR